MTAVWGIELPDSEKLVLLALADNANDEGVCWPSIATIGKKCSKSERTVQRAIASLELAGHLGRVDRPGRGTYWIVHPRHPDTPVTTTPVTGGQITPVILTPKPKENHQPPPTKRPTRLPADFVPVMAEGSKTKETVDGWPPGRLEDEIEGFFDRHNAKGETSLDWQASWRTWVRLAKRWEPRERTFGNGGHRNGSGSRVSVDPFTKLLNDRANGETDYSDAGDD